MLVADTDVVSYLFKRHVLASRYEDLLEGHVVLLSFMTVAEIEYGMHSDGWGAIRRDAMRSYLESRFTTVYPDTKTIQVWATLVARCESRGQSVSFGDSWIAATALRTGVALVTHNAKHYRQIEDLEVITCS